MHEGLELILSHFCVSKKVSIELFSEIQIIWENTKNDSKKYFLSENAYVCMVISKMKFVARIDEFQYTAYITSCDSTCEYFVYDIFCGVG